MNLLLRFYDPGAGAITLSGIDLQDVRRRDLRERIGLVTQETLLFDDSVFENIRYGRSEASRDEVTEAARRAHAHRFITEQLADGYDTIVGPGGNRLSGGQRQRISLARAILRDPEILILDEATSQIDVESERLIHQVLEEFTRGRTALIITHRPSTLELADRIVVMDQGRIVDVGSFRELAGRCRMFRSLAHLDLRESA
jgi:ATP-binding cassette subfamily B protein/subfamily B ATP-binding cassette protein MsbA